jgi:hypothetical protein
MTVYLIVFMCGLIGHVVAAWSLLTSLLEMHSLSILHLNGARRLTAISNVLRDAFMMSAQMIVLLVGAAGILIGDEKVPITRIGMVGWILNSLLCTAMCVVDRMRRIRQGRLYDESLPPKVGTNFVHRRSTDPGVNR